jgi:hypothetical protein
MGGDRLLAALAPFPRSEVRGAHLNSDGQRMPSRTLFARQCVLECERMAPMGRLEDKAEKVRALGLDVSGRGTRPNGGTEGLYINSSFFDEQFVDQIIAGTPLQIVVENRERFIRSL